MKTYRLKCPHCHFEERREFSSRTPGYDILCPNCEESHMVIAVEADRRSYKKRRDKVKEFLMEEYGESFSFEAKECRICLKPIAQKQMRCSEECFEKDEVHMEESSNG